VSLRRLAERVSPRHRRWRALLASLTVDPEAVPPADREVGPRDFVICGCSRTGTSLVAATLFRPPRIVTVMEPWDAYRLPPRQLFTSLREEIGSGLLSRGRLDIEALRRAGEVRWCRDGERPAPVTADEDHLLGVKVPAFRRWLDLAPSLRAVVCLRDPAEVLDSFERVGGRLGVGLEYDITFNRAMNERLGAIDDLAERRLALFDEVHARLLPHLGRPEVHVVRYEDWFTRPEEVRAGLSAFLGEEVGDHPRLELGAPASASARALAARSRTAAALGY
jgi:hypothetical protein